jgi:hypothetical protein
VMGGVDGLQKFEISRLFCAKHGNAKTTNFKTVRSLAGILVTDFFARNTAMPRPRISKPVAGILVTELNSA